MKYYMIAGEASGDLHGSNLIRHLKQLDQGAEIRCWGGDLMAAQGATIIKHYRDLAFMGFVEVILNLSTILKNIAFCKKDITDYHPDVVIFIDYPGFNLRIAEWAKKAGFTTIYYISPQIWAWKESRVHTIKQVVDFMLVILPFEKDFYKKWNFDVEYVGHPLVSLIDNFRANHLPGHEKNIIALLPGSRKQEIATKLPVMLQVSVRFPAYKFVVAKAPGITEDYYNSFLSGYANVSAYSGRTYELLNNAVAALVTSGTATLETALFGVPEVVCYKGSRISYEIAKRVIRVKFISLVNLIMNREIVKELIQQDFNVESVTSELSRLLYDEHAKQKLALDYKELKEILSSGNDASMEAANLITNFLKG